MTHKWNYQPITPEQAEASQQLAQELGISPILGKLLVERGITTAADARKFFRPQLPDLYDPFLMKDMDIAVERLNKAMGKKERILVYGDYDVDGTTAVALVYKFIQQFYSNIDYYIPDRYNEGCWDGFSIFGGAVLDFEDFLVSNLFLPLGSLVYLLFCWIDSCA